MQIPVLPSPQPLAPAQQRMMDKAKELEAAFLSEMLSYTGIGKASESFGGGAGEEQFGSFLRAEQARLIVDRGGVGLAELIFQSMTKAGGANHDA